MLYVWMPQSLELKDWRKPLLVFLLFPRTEHLYAFLTLSIARYPVDSQITLEVRDSNSIEKLTLLLCVD